MKLVPFLLVSLAVAGCAAPVGSAQADPTPQAGPEKDIVEALLARMTVEEKVSQLMMSYPPLDKTGPVTVGSVIFVGNLLKSEEAVVQRVSDLNRRARIPLLVAADVEGGALNKLSFLPGLEAVPSNRELGAVGVDEARAWGVKVGQGMKRLGLNVALAPVLDVAGKGMMFDSGRSFGADPARVAELGAAYIDGLGDAGVVGVGKHWPGYGELDRNTDHHLVVTERSAEEVARHAQAFVKVGDGLAGVMLANVGYTSYGGVPAILSPELVHQAHDHGWITITDDLAIAALAESTGGSSEEVVRRAFLAGNDVLLTTAPIDWDKALDYRGIVLALLQEQPELMPRLDDSVRRVLELKRRMGLLEGVKP